MSNKDIMSRNFYDVLGSRDQFNGTSFRMSKWKPQTFYAHDDMNVDFVAYNDCLLYCIKNHWSDSVNQPILKFDSHNNIIGIEDSQYWNFVLARGKSGADGKDGLPGKDGAPGLPGEKGEKGDKGDPGEGMDGIAGGNAGQALVKNSDDDFDYSWKDVVLDTINFDVDASAYDADSASVDVTFVDDKMVFTFGLPRGEVGPPGADGQTGESGKDGVDGNGFDYIFLLTESKELTLSQDPSQLPAVQEDNFVPSGWSTYSQQVNETLEYQWVSNRKKTSGVWSKFSKPVILNSYANEGVVPEVSFTSFVFCRTNNKWKSTDIVPTGGTYQSPFPTNAGTIGGAAVVWSDSVPAGSAQIYMSTYTFTNKENYEGSGTLVTPIWSTPRPMSDTSNFQVEFSSKVNPTTPESLQSYYNADSINYEDTWRKKNTDWSDDGTNAIWMATSTCRNGIWSNWSVSKIKGEDGADGKSVSIKGTLSSVDDLPAKGNDGDSYLINGELWVWDGDSWECVGKIQGPAGADGARPFVHIKYADILLSDTNKDNLHSDGYWIGFTRVEDETPGETPGDYIGIYADYVEDDSLIPTLYTWRKWVGDDGWGYEYIYTLTKTYDAPSVPTESKNEDDWIPTGWTDNPGDVSADYPYCWMCYRRKVNNVWSAFIGSASNEGKAALFAKWGEQGIPGEDGAGVEYIYAVSSVDTDSFDNSGISLPDDSWEYDSPQTPWTDNPSGVNLNNPVEWVCERIKPQGGEWSAWGKPSVWSHFGKDGKDGPGLEYIFCACNQSSINTGLKKVTTLTAVQEDDYVPDAYTVSSVTYTWTDNVPATNYVNRYLWASIRRKKNGEWGQFEEPKLWSQYVTDGADGAESAFVKMWQRSAEKPSRPTLNCTYIFASSSIEFTDGSSINNGWQPFIPETYTKGQDLYSLSTNVRSTSGTASIKPEDWSIALESRDGEDGIDGSGQSAVSITVDPDSIIVNIDENYETKWAQTISCTANYYYGVTAILSQFASSAPSGITVKHVGDFQTIEHNFEITIAAGVKMLNPVPVTITLAPVDDSEGYGSRSKAIQLNPVQIADVYTIMLSQDQIIVPRETTWSKTITASIFKNGAVYSGTNAALYYTNTYGAEVIWPTNGLVFNQTNIDDYPNEILVTLKVDGISILHQTISILRNGTDGTNGEDGKDGADGTSLERIHEYYYYNNSSTITTAETLTFDLINSVGSDITINSKYTWTYGKPGRFNTATPYLWNVEYVELTNGNSYVTEPALLGAYGKPIRNIKEYYTANNLGSGVVLNIVNGVPQLNYNVYTWEEWNAASHTVTEDKPYLWNAEVVQYDDGTYNNPIATIVGRFVKGDDGQSVNDIWEYYKYFAPGVTPNPNWKNYSQNFDGDTIPTLYDADGTPWQYETYPSMPSGKTCLWNVEVIKWADIGDGQDYDGDGDNDGYTHTSCILLSDRGSEITKIEEFYMISSKEFGVIFNGSNTEEDGVNTTSPEVWHLISPNESVITPNETYPYLWNAERITYKDGVIEYRPASRIAIWIKGDKGDPGADANNLSIELSDDLNAILVNPDTNKVYRETEYVNYITLYQANVQKTFKSITVTFPGYESTRLPNLFRLYRKSGSNWIEISNGVDISSFKLSEIKFSITIPQGLVVENRIPINIKVTSLDDDNITVLEKSRVYNIIAVPEAVRYQLTASPSRLFANYLGELKDDSITLNIINPDSSASVTTIPDGYSVWYQIDDENPNQLESSYVTAIDGYYVHKFYLVKGSTFSLDNVRDYCAVEVSWEQKPQVSLTISPSSQSIEVNSSGEVLENTALVFNGVFLYNGIRKTLGNSSVMSVDITSSITNLTSSVSNNQLTINIPKGTILSNSSYNVNVTATYNDGISDLIADYPVLINTEIIALSITATQDTINLGTRRSNSLGSTSELTYSQVIPIKIDVYYGEEELTSLLGDNDVEYTLSYNWGGSYNISISESGNLVWPINLVIDGIYYAETHGTNSDIWDYISNNGGVFTLQARHRSTGLIGRREFAITVNNTNYWKIESSPYVINENNSTEPVRVYVSNINDDYASISDMKTNGVGLYYSIDSGEEILITGDNTITEGINFVWYPNAVPIYSNIKFYLYEGTWNGNAFNKEKFLTADFIERIDVAKFDPFSVIPATICIDESISYTLASKDLFNNNVKYTCDGSGVSINGNTVTITTNASPSFTLNCINASTNALIVSASRSTYTNGKDGENGADGAPGKDGEDGKDGQDGVNGATTYTFYLYTINSSAGVSRGSIPAGLYTYNTITGTLTLPSGSNSAWTSTHPSSASDVYRTDVQVSTTSISTTLEFVIGNGVTSADMDFNWSAPYIYIKAPASVTGIEYLANAFPDTKIDNTDAITLSMLLGVKDGEGNVVAGMYGGGSGSPEQFTDGNNTLMMYAGSDASAASTASFRVYSNGDLYANKGVFGGLIKKSLTTINTDNVDQYTSQYAGTNYWIDINKAGTLIYIEDQLNKGFQLPTVYLGVVTSPSENIWDVRSLIGNTILIYTSDSVSMQGISGVFNSVGGVGSTQISSNQCISLTCELKVDASDKETIAWSYKIINQN